jgi:cysteinyl-tRNA synthetase
MPLRVYDTRARAKRDFEPLVPGRVGMYVCGPTVYDHPHLGHARAAVSFDVIRRSLEALGYAVTYVQNITDVDDKIINRAAEEAASPWEIAERYTRSYEHQMMRLGVRPPSLTPKATGHIPDMIALIQRLIDGGYAYVLDDGDVYFSVTAFDDYGGLSGRSLDDMRAGERVEPDPRKRHPMDFALWKGAKQWQVHWPAPWGPGRPGWHIECSAMSMKYLGETFDIHGGGQDLVFPHHENECAQSSAATGAAFARYWLHNGFVTIDDEKMSKSLKNFVLLADVLAEHPPPVVRLMLTAVHYRSPLAMSPEVLADARGQWERFTTFARNASEVADPDAKPIEEWRARFHAALEDDFNTPIAFSVVHELIGEATPAVEAARANDAGAYLATFRELTGTLGLDPIGDWPEGPAMQRVQPLVDFLLGIRQEARAAKDFARADAIRDVLTSAGVVVEDKAGGAHWHLADPWS